MIRNIKSSYLYKLFQAIYVEVWKLYFCACTRKWQFKCSKNGFSLKTCMASFFLLYQIMFQMQNNALFLKEKYMVSNQPDEINKGDWFNKSANGGGRINHLAPYKHIQCLLWSTEFVEMPFYANTRKHKSSEYSFHFLRTVPIRVSCTDLTGTKEK